MQNVAGDDMVALLGDHWNIVNGEHKNDTFKCNIIDSTVSFRYLKTRVTLYIRFSYERWMKKNNCWVSLQAGEHVVLPLQICITLPSGVVEVLSASTHWNLQNIREHLIIIRVEDISKEQFKVKNRKIGMRIEPKTFVDAE